MPFFYGRLSLSSHLHADNIWTFITFPLVVRSPQSILPRHAASPRLIHVHLSREQHTTYSKKSRDEFSTTNEKKKTFQISLPQLQLIIKNGKRPVCLTCSSFQKSDKRRNQKEYVRNRTETEQYRWRLRRKSVSSQFIGPEGSLVMIFSSGARCEGMIFYASLVVI